MTAEDELRRALFDAIDRGDRAGFEELVSRRAEDILASFAGWTKVPEELRGDPGTLQRYANGLVVVAETFAKAGRPELMAQLLGEGRSNPIDRWRALFDDADGRVRRGRPREAIPLLEQVLSEMDGWSGTAIAEYRPKVLGLLGAAHFRAGDLTGAERRTREALEECRRAADAEGVRVYTENLGAIRRARPLLH